MPANPPKRKQLGLLNIMLALALGASTWWCVDSLLSIKPDYTLRFPNRGELQDNRNEYKPSFPFRGQCADVDEKYLIIQIPNDRSVSITTELYDLPTGRLIASHPETLGERLASPVDYSLPHQLANANGCLTLFAIGMSANSSTEYAVCEWNLLTNKRRILKPHVPGTSYLLSPNGSKLIATTPLSPFMPSLMGPPHWANLLPLKLLADSENDIHRVGPLLVRVYSLPDVNLMSSFVLPSPCGLSIIEITPDGSGLLIGQAAMVNHYFETLNRNSIQVFQPQGLAVFNLANGHLRQRIADHPGEILEFYSTELSPNLIHADLENDPYQKQKVINSEVNKVPKDEVQIEELVHRVRERQVAYYHLPTNQWINVDGDRAFAAASSSQADRILSQDKSTDNWRVWEIDRKGSSTQLSWLTCQLGNDVKLLDASNQLTFIRTQYSQLPKWLQELRGRLGSLLDRFARPSFSVVFYDYMRDRELGVYRLGSCEPSRLNKSAKGNYLILNSTNETEHEVAVFSLPVKAWSPWWARSAGFLVGALVFYWWLVVRRKAVRIAWNNC